MTDSIMTIRAQHRETGADLTVDINDEFLEKLRTDGREDLILITETMLHAETKIQHERAFFIATLVAIRDLCERNSDIPKAFSNSLATMLMDRYKEEILGTIGDEGMQRAAQQVSELLSSVIATYMNPAAIPASPKPNTEH